MAVFENESNSSQDASYREHLDRNWLNGNSAFDQINQNIADWQNLISSLSSRISTLESENDKRIQEITGLRNELTNYQLKTDQQFKLQQEETDQQFKLQQEEIDKLNNAVFGHVHEINYDKPRQQDPYKHEVIDKSKHRNPLNKNPVSYELNYSTVNGKHNSIEIDTGIGHMKGKKL